MPAFENLLVDFASIYTNIFQRFVVEIHRSKSNSRYSRFHPNGIVVNNYTQEQNFTLFYQSKGLDTMRIWLPYIKCFWVVLINTLICFNNVNCLLNDNDKKSSDLCTVRPQGYQPPFHSLSGQCLLIWWWQYLMYTISGLYFFCRLKINLYTKSIFFSSLFH